ncbi:MAG: hypothetical protein P4L43_11900 [Syntrophobacteraceae bacterium]|nr:hypothetical protein [Syntrophobacteraceae bacterium]
MVRALRGQLEDEKIVVDHPNGNCCCVDLLTGFDAAFILWYLCMIKDVIIHKYRQTGGRGGDGKFGGYRKRKFGLPAGAFAPDANKVEQVIEFFAERIRNANTRKANAKAPGCLAAWCVEHGINELGHARALHVASYIEGL